MAKKSKQKEEAKKPSYSDYPIKTLFRAAMLGGCVAFLLYYLGNPNDIFSAFFRAFLIFVVVAIAGGAVMIVLFYIVSGMRRREMEAAAEEERKMALEALMNNPPPPQHAHPQHPPEPTSPAA